VLGAHPVEGVATEDGLDLGMTAAVLGEDILEVAERLDGLELGGVEIASSRNTCSYRSSPTFLSHAAMSMCRLSVDPFGPPRVSSLTPVDAERTIRRHGLTDAEWKRLEPLLPPGSALVAAEGPPARP
jgi:hypothetical protein